MEKEREKEIGELVLSCCPMDFPLKILTGRVYMYFDQELHISFCG